MNWLSKIFGRSGDEAVRESSSKDNGTAPKKKDISPPYEGIDKTIHFGRYSDNNKSQKKTQSWYIAEDRYKEKNYPAAFEAFFSYLRDEDEDNVTYTLDGNKFKFTLIQGSKKVHGESDGEIIIARSPLAVMETPGTAVMRRLLELNYSLYYSHSALDEGNTLNMVFISDVTATNPSKLYYGLRELATKADRQDDLLLTDFSYLKPTDTDHIIKLSEQELEVKYKYFRTWIQETLDKVATLNQDSFSGAIAYLLLALIYRIDFLILPEAKLLAQLEKINAMYWDKKDEIALVQRNQMMKEAIKKLLDITKEDFDASLYHAKSTFSIATPPKSDKVRDHIISANKDSHWYVENKYPELAVTINEYGMLYNQFIYSMPKVQTDLIVVYMAVMHADFFKELGMKTPFYDPERKEFNKEAISAAATLATDRFKDKFKNMRWDDKRISYDSVYDFGITFSEHMANMNLETKRD
jgi:hypothetical protein